MPPTNLVTTKEAADILGVVPSTVNRMVTSGRLTPSSRVDGPTRIAMHLFRRSDVERLARKRAAA